MLNTVINVKVQLVVLFTVLETTSPLTHINSLCQFYTHADLQQYAVFKIQLGGRIRMYIQIQNNPDMVLQQMSIYVASA